MRKTTRRFAFISLLIAMVGLGAGGAADVAASAHGQWFQGTNGCLYQWDAYQYAYHVSACSRSDGGVDFWQNAGGQWYWSVSAIQNADGSTWIYAAGSGGWMLYPAATSISIGGGTGMTGNALVDQVLMDSVYNNNQIILNGGIRNCDYTYEC